MGAVAGCQTLLSCGFAFSQELSVFVFGGVRPPPKAVSLQTGFGVMGCIQLCCSLTGLVGCSAGEQSSLHLDALDLPGLSGMGVEI